VVLQNRERLKGRREQRNGGGVTCENAQGRLGAGTPEAPARNEGMRKTSGEYEKGILTTIWRRKV
jgi:hypothetical protein